MNGRPWTADDDATLRINYADHPTFLVAYVLDRSESATYGRATLLGLRKSPAFLAKPASGRTTGRQGIGTRFKKGHVPANKGLRRPGWAPGRMASTQFKKGAMTGAAARNYKPIGSTRIVYGNLERKFTDDPARYPASRWRPVHRMVWEAAHGPVPKGRFVVFKPGRHTIVEADITLDRLELVTRAENMRRNSYHTRYPKEIALAIQARGALTRVINKRAHSHERGHQRPAQRTVRHDPRPSRSGKSDGHRARKGGR